MVALRRSARITKCHITESDAQASKLPAARNKSANTAVETDQPLSSSSPRRANTAEERAAKLRDRKLKSFAAHAQQSPFPDFVHPTPAECVLAHDILAKLHGDCVRPDEVVAPKDAAGCGNSPSVLDALVRTILSQNTSNANSSRAKRSMDAEYGGSDHWDAIASGGQARLQQSIASGGLSVVKSRVIINILHEVKERYGAYSLNHLFNASDDDAMRELLSFQGVGAKTASCVLLFCLRRDSFAVDTHVYRITGMLGWRPMSATRDQTQAHLEARVPLQEKYPLHVLIIRHGKTCTECRAGGVSRGKCLLRSAFGKQKIEGEMKSEDDVDVNVKEKEDCTDAFGIDAVKHEKDHKHEAKAIKREYSPAAISTGEKKRKRKQTAAKQ